ncbi:MAG: hypothetical protein ACW99Q_19660, partial [Candidatus Kariarchaeaceae archaeon]
MWRKTKTRVGRFIKRNRPNSPQVRQLGFLLLIGIQGVLLLSGYGMIEALSQTEQLKPYGDIYLFDDENGQAEFFEDAKSLILRTKYWAKDQLTLLAINDTNFEWHLFKAKLTDQGVTEINNQQIELPGYDTNYTRVSKYYYLNGSHIWRLVWSYRNTSNSWQDTSIAKGELQLFDENLQSIENYTLVEDQNHPIAKTYEITHDTIIHFFIENEKLWLFSMDQYRPRENRSEYTNLTSYSLKN